MIQLLLLLLVSKVSPRLCDWLLLIVLLLLYVYLFVCLLLFVTVSLIFKLYIFDYYPTNVFIYSFIYGIKCVIWYPHCCFQYLKRRESFTDLMSLLNADKWESCLRGSFPAASKPIMSYNYYHTNNGNNNENINSANYNTSSGSRSRSASRGRHGFHFPVQVTAQGKKSSNCRRPPF